MKKLLLLLLLVAAPAHAAEPSPPNIGISLSLLRLAASMAEVKAEHSLGPLGFALLGCAGMAPDDDSHAGGFTAVGGGVQGLWYALGSFRRGLHLGLEGRYESKSSTYRSEGAGIHSQSQGWQLGGLAGLRYSLPRGLFLEGQGFLGRTWLATATTCCSSVRQDDTASNLAARVALNVGWLF